MDIEDLKAHLKKMITVIDADTVFTLGNLRVVKRKSLDDLICCTYALLPAIYKKLLKNEKDYKEYHSMICYNILMRKLSVSFLGNKTLCFINFNEITNLVQTISTIIKRDLNKLEEKYHTEQ